MDSLYAQFPARSVERLVIDAIWDSEETYAYSSLEEFLFELRFRKETVNAARELNRSRLSFATFHNSKANPKYWDRTPNGGFRMKSGVKAFPSHNRYIRKRKALRHRMRYGNAHCVL